MLFWKIKIGKGVSIKESFFPKFKSGLFFLAYLLMLPELTYAQLAFPEAEGFGAVVTGGRGGDVYHVTRLDDDNSQGTLRHAITSADGPRIIVFDTGGSIKLGSKLKINKDNLTFAGQTAPGGGITVYAHATEIEDQSNIIIRYMRFRCGDFNAKDRPANPDKNIPFKKGKGLEILKGSEGDSLSIHRSNKIILDHVSLSWSIDEALDISSSNTVTVQYSIISEGLFDSYHHKGKHSRTVLLGGLNTDSEMISKTKGYTFVGNIFAHSNMRNPVVGGEKHPPNEDPMLAKGLNIDFSNNVIFNWGQRSGHTATNAFINMNYVDNYLIAGPDTNGPGSPPGDEPPRDDNGNVIEKSKNINQNTAMRVEAEDEDDFNSFFIYQSGNYMDTDQDSDNDDGQLVGDEAFIDFEPSERLSTRHAFPVAGGRDASEAYDHVLADAGASFPRDTIDARIVNGIITRTGRIINSQDEPGIGGDRLGGLLDPIVVGTAPIDSDNDGMPDSWENANGTEPNIADNAGDVNGDGYDNIENYINSLVGDSDRSSRLDKRVSASSNDVD